MRKEIKSREIVIPAKAGIQLQEMTRRYGIDSLNVICTITHDTRYRHHCLDQDWIPACAGMTKDFFTTILYILGVLCGDGFYLCDLPVRLFI
jgi:hypothetical protein